MDCLGLPGETPMMPPPPKVCPVGPVPDPVEELPLGAFESVLPVAPVLPDPLEESVELPVAPEASVGQPAAPVGAPVVEPDDPENELPPLDEPAPLPAVEGLLSPVPMHPGMFPIGWPKKPSVGVLFWPKRMIFHSSLPVVGSIYFLRRKRIWLVLTSASMLGG